MRTYLGRDGYRRGLGAHRRGGACGVHEAPDPPRRARHRPARRRRLRSLPPYTRAVRGAHSHADGARRGARPRRRSRDRSRRLRSQAVLAARARRTREGDPPALRALAARQPHRARRRHGRHRGPRGDGRRRVGRADGEGVRSPRLLPREPRRRALARPAARSRVGDELPRRHADRGRPRRPAAAQARTADADQDRPRGRVQGRRARERAAVPAAP